MTRKGVYFISTLIMAIILGCSQKVELAKITKEGKIEGDIRQCYDETTPEWVLQPTKYPARAQYIFVSVGSFPCYNMPPGECRDPAVHNARANLASQLSSLVRKAVKDYKKIYTGGVNIRNYEALSQSITETILMGAEHIDTWISRCGEVYALVGIPRSYAPAMARILTNNLLNGIAGVKVISEKDAQEFVQFLMNALMRGI